MCLDCGGKLERSHKASRPTVKSLHPTLEIPHPRKVIAVKLKNGGPDGTNRLDIPNRTRSVPASTDFLYVSKQYNADSTSLDGRLMKKGTRAQRAWQPGMKQTQTTCEGNNTQMKNMERRNIRTVGYLSSTRCVMKIFGSSQDHLAVAPAVCAHHQKKKKLLFW